MNQRTFDTAILAGTALILGYGALSFLASCIPPPQNGKPDAGAPPPEGVLPPLEPYEPRAEHYLCSCEDQACMDEWICEETGGAAPICLSYQCGGKVFHHCVQECL